MAAHASDASPFEWQPTPARQGITWTCPRCRKRAYASFQHAAWDAEQVRRRRNHGRMTVYWSRDCQAFHTGEKTKKPRT